MQYILCGPFIILMEQLISRHQIPKKKKEKEITLMAVGLGGSATPEVAKPPLGHWVSSTIPDSWFVVAKFYRFSQR